MKAEKEALKQRLREGFLKRKEGANLAIQFLSSMYHKEPKLDDSILEQKDAEIKKAEIGKEEMKTPIKQNDIPQYETETDDFFE